MPKFQSQKVEKQVVRLQVHLRKLEYSWQGFFFYFRILIQKVKCEAQILKNVDGYDFQLMKNPKFSLSEMRKDQEKHCVLVYISRVYFPSKLMESVVEGKIW